MSKETVRKWLGTMKAEGLAKSDADCARLLGVHPNTITNWRNGKPIDQPSRLAMSALLNRLEPY